MSTSIVQQIVEKQSSMESLWIANPTFTEMILISALRHLHAVVEGDSLTAETAKNVYWGFEDHM